MPHAIHLKIMNTEEYEKFIESSSTLYARSSPFYKDLPLVEALMLIHQEFKTKIAPEGLNTRGHYFLAILKNEEQIGYFHFGEFPKGSQCMYGWNFHIYETHQKQGHGKAAMKAAKNFLAEKKYKKVALNVMATNPAAIALYESFGFTVTQVNMETEI